MNMTSRFEVYKNGQRLSSFQPVAAYTVGPESVPMPGEVAFRDGYLHIVRGEDAPAAVAMLWEVGNVGTFHLETTRLPLRVKPYNLNVEMARFRLMKIIQKYEDWNFFDFQKADKFSQKLREAQDLLSEALGKLEDGAEASRLADQSLVIAVQLSEELSVFHADLLINRRRQSNAFVKHVFGCKVDVSVQNQKYREMLWSNFDYAVLPMSWRAMEPQEGTMETDAVDVWAEALTKKRIPIIAGPLINFDETDLPDWMFIWENDFDTVRELAYQRVQRLVSRYRKAVSLWNVVAGLPTNRAFALTFEQMIEMTRLLIAQVKNVHPGARTLVQIPMAFGEYHAKTPTSVSPVLYAEMVAQSGIGFEGFALEMEMGVPLTGQYMRDLFQISAMLDRFSTLGKPIFITACGAPGRPNADPGDCSEGRLNPAAAGVWHKPWDPSLQAEWMDAVYHLALSKPFVESVAWGNLADINQTVPGGGLLDDMFQPKPVFEKLQAMRHKVQSWQGRRP
ncbi:MAG: hypothetical protein ACHRHE_04180 [Tepidisphaerales bacterium]